MEKISQLDFNKPKKVLIVIILEIILVSVKFRNRFIGFFSIEWIQEDLIIEFGGYSGMVEVESMELYR